MFRTTAALPNILVLLAVLGLAACTRGQSDYGLNADRLKRAATAANAENGLAKPGSMREFSSRVGDTVHFTTDSTELSRQAQTTLIAQAQWLNQYSQYTITIAGHADERGTREYNLALGARRADTVKRFLSSRGVHPRRIQTVTFGKERPVAVCADISCWSQNRRAVTVLGRRQVATRY